MGKFALLFTGGTFLSGEGGAGREVSRECSNRNQGKTTELLNILLRGKEFIAREIYNIDSSDLEPSHWLSIKTAIENIEKEEGKMEGYVLIHGTDTLEYTAAALSFFLKEISGNIIITGSMESIEKENSDALDNLKCSLQALDQLSSSGGHYVAFGGKLLQGNKVRKLDTHSKSTFDTPGYEKIGHFENDSLILDSMQNKQYLESIDHKLFLNNNIRELANVQLIRFFPGMSLGVFDHLLSTSGLKGVVLEGYGDGNFPKNINLINKIKKLVEKGIFVVIKSQCVSGYVDHKYEGAKKILETDYEHIISGKNMTSPAALTKLICVLSQTNDPQQVKSYMEKNIAGEML